MKTASKIVNLAKSLKGVIEGSKEHKAIIDKYNSHKPLARGYKMKYTDAWCSCFVSYLSIECGYTDIIPTEVGCGKHIELFKKIGEWVEADSHVPEPGDIIFYDWKDDGKGENKDGASHVGIVISKPDKLKKFKVIEGNMDNKVGERTMKVNAKYIRGYGVPKYSEPSETPSEPSETIYVVKKGDTLSKIANKYDTTWRKIYNDNIKVIGNNPNLIKPGQKLVVK